MIAVILSLSLLYAMSNKEIFPITLEKDVEEIEKMNLTPAIKVVGGVIVALRPLNTAAFLPAPFLLTLGKLIFASIGGLPIIGLPLPILNLILSLGEVL